MRSIFSTNRSHSSREINSRDPQSSISVSSSVSDPSETYRNQANCFGLFQAAPSAMFTGTDTAALRICETRPNFSAEGKEFVAAYNSLTSSKLSAQAFNFLCGFISLNISSNIINHNIKNKYVPAHQQHSSAH